MKNKATLLTKLLPFFLFIVSAESYAIPSFSRMNNMQCSGCHSAFPALNSLGRTYKEQGYRFSGGQMPGNKVTDNLMLDEIFPISAAIIARPFDKKDSGETKNRAIHEIEVMVAGHIGYGVSGFIELEAEDEEDFNVESSLIQGTYSFGSEINVQVSRAPILYFDPYNSFTSSRRSTINRNVAIDQSFGGADNGGSLRKARQNLTLYGRPIDELFYGVSYSGLASDNEGQDADTYIARLAYDVIPSLMVGGMVLKGQCSVESGGGESAGGPCAVDLDYSRYAVDFEWMPFNNQLVLNAVVMKASDDVVSGGHVSNNAYYFQGFYNFMKDGRPLVTPIIRFDAYEENDGKNNIESLTVGVSHFVRENLKLRVEYWDRNGEGTTLDDDRFTLQFDAYF
jgi:hypothetical protein